MLSHPLIYAAPESVWALAGVLLIVVAVSVAVLVAREWFRR
jgi:hypothetical protein